MEDKKLFILNLEDNPKDTELIQALLEEEGMACEILRVETEKDFISAVVQGSFDLFLVDFKLPGFDGMSALAIAKEKCPDIPFIFVSGSIGEDIAIEALKNGATDYVLKDKLSRLAPAVRRALQEAQARAGHKQMQVALEKSEERYRQLFAAAGDAMFVLDQATGAVLDANDAASRLYGYNRVEFFGLKNTDLSAEPEKTAEAIKGELKLAPIRYHRKKDGTVFPVEITASYYDQEGRRVSVVDIRDITERRKAENLFRELSRKMELILNSAGEGIYGLDLEGKVIFINPAGARMLGYEVGELIGVHSHSTWHHSRPDGTPFPIEECRLSEAVKEGEAGTAENLIFWKKDGSSFPIEYSSTPMFEDDKLVGAVVTFRDISTQLREAEERNKLEAQFLQAQKIEAVGTLASGVAHDFNNILSTIIGYGHLTLMKMGDDDPLRLNLQQILESADRATTLTQSLLAFSRKQTINPDVINLNDMLKRFEKILLRLLREDIELKTVCTDEDLIVMADSGQIEQALMNLVTNARDAMPEGGRLTIETRLVEMDERFLQTHGYGKEGEYALILVTDTGTGMDKETQLKIFEPFFTTKEQGKGTGLGLAMVYGTIKKHEGFINVYSEEGRGTSFKIYLPIVRGAVEARGTEAGETVPLRGGTETILVAEDDDSLRKLTTTVLEHFGYRVLAAADGEEAVKQFIENKDSIQLIILDGIMPKKNGKEAYEEIRALQPDIKAIFVSGYAEDVFTRKGIPQDRVTFLLKPVMPTILVKSVREVLDRG